MRELLVTLDWLDHPLLVGMLKIAESRGRENYRFSYFPEWINAKGFAIDPQHCLS